MKVDQQRPQLVVAPLEVGNQQAGVLGRRRVPEPGSQAVFCDDGYRAGEEPPQSAVFFDAPGGGAVELLAHRQQQSRVHLQRRLPVRVVDVGGEVGDEAERHFPGRRPNGYSRDTIVAGVAVQVDALRSYLQIGFAPVVNGPAEPWEIEIGAEFLPACRKWWGNAFAAMHAHLRQENDFGGVVTLEAGWRWQSAEFGSILRIGLHGSLGRSPQYQFYDLVERQIGLAGGLDF